jgi:DNA polymerase I-like protein with 3'-5' exonuclease and polymerase domains
MPIKHETEEDRWTYNCEDCVRTREIGETTAEMIPKMGLAAAEEFQQSMFHPILAAMLRGVRVDFAVRDRLAGEVQEELAKREEFLQFVLGHSINPRSSQQMCKLFYEDLKQQPNMTRAKKGVPGHLTCDDEALQRIKAREPLLTPIVDAIADIRTLGIFLNNFILAGLDIDGRLRCSYNICGTATYRLSSSKNAFGGGCNLQTVPSDKSKSVGKAKARGGEFTLPNLRTMIVPDPGFTFFDIDLDRADLQVVVWEAEDELLKAALRVGADIHLLNAFHIEGKEPPPLEELAETHPRYPDHRAPRKYLREFAKIFCHATNYGGGARTVAVNTGRSIHEIDKAQKHWFGAHPGIKRWQERTEAQIRKHRFVENRFGFRWHIFDRVDAALPEALAWVPQSTVGIVINKIWKNYHDHLPQVQTLLQVHDSLGGQLPTHQASILLPKMRELSRIVIPYPDPLVIPTGIKTSSVSWGDCA